MEKNFSNKDEITYMEDWRNEHGEPDFVYLQSLVTEDTLESTERLRSIADDLNVEYDADAPAQDLVGRIRLATEQNEDGIPVVTT